ncbi:MAG: hypothetical protein U1E87_00295 [Alphaproteobacteria bacterium]
MTLVERSAAPCLSVRGAFLRLWVLGLAGAASAALAPLPAKLVAGPGLSELTIRLLTFLNTSIVLAALVGVGAIAAREVGLHSLIARRVHPRYLPRGHAFHWVQAAVLLGTTMFLAQWLIDRWLWPMPSQPRLQLVHGAMETSGASQVMGTLLQAVNEELMLRWGLMSGLMWVLALLLRRPPGRPGAAIAWAAIIGASVLSVAASFRHCTYANEPAGVLLVPLSPAPPPVSPMGGSSGSMASRPRSLPT